jgi:hypothetical protein
VPPILSAIVDILHVSSNHVELHEWCVHLLDHNSFSLSFGVSHTSFASAFLRRLQLMTADDFITANVAIETAINL